MRVDSITLPRDTWVRATLALVVVHLGVLAVVHARPGRIGAILWYVHPPFVALAAVSLLAIAFFRTLRRRQHGPRGDELTAYALLAALVVSVGIFRTYPSSYDDRPSNIRFRLPLDGLVTVAWGGPTLSVNYHVVMPDQRWAYDLFVTEGGRTFRNSSALLAEYYAYGRPVLAPADAVVQSVHDGEPDGPIGQWRVVRATGNHVVLQVGLREFLFVAHLQAGSITVRPGDRVESGQMIGRVGNSGNSSEPHVHLHLQDSPIPYLGEGIPFYFYRYRVGGVEVERGMPFGGRERRSRRWPGALTGQIVEHVDSRSE